MVGIATFSDETAMTTITSARHSTPRRNHRRSRDLWLRVQRKLGEQFGVRSRGGVGRAEREVGHGGSPVAAGFEQRNVTVRQRYANVLFRDVWHAGP